MSVSVYANPTDQTMLYAQGSYSTSSKSYYLQAKFGGAIQPNLFVGPEVTLTGRTEFDQSWAGYEEWRAGAFIAGLKLGTFLFGFSAGYAHDRQQGNGGYVSTSARVAF